MSKSFDKGITEINGRLLIKKGIGPFKKEVDIDPRSYDFLEICYSYTFGGADLDHTYHGHILWLKKTDGEKFPIFSVYQGEIKLGTNDTRKIVRKRAEELSQKWHVPINDNSSFSLLKDKLNTDVNTHYMERIDTMRLQAIKVDFEELKKISFSSTPENGILLQRSTKVAAFFWGIGFWMVALVLFLSFPSYWIIAAVVAWMGLIVAIMTGFKESLLINQNGYEYNSKGRFGLVNNKKKISFDQLEEILVIKNAGLNAYEGLGIISDSEIIYFGTGLKLDALIQLVILASWSVIDYNKFVKIYSN